MQNNKNAKLQTIQNMRIGSKQIVNTKEQNAKLQKIIRHEKQENTKQQTEKYNCYEYCFT